MVEIAVGGLIAIGAGLAIGFGALGTAWVQASVGSSAMGVIAERPEEASKLLIYILIPESILILAFVIAFLLVGSIGTAGEAVA